LHFGDLYTESPQVGVADLSHQRWRQVRQPCFKVKTMHTAPILEHLKKHGQLLDLEIAAATGIPLPKVRTSLSDLSARGEISRCSVTRFDNGKPVEAILCRISGYVPKPAPGRKPSAKKSSGD